MTEQEHTQASVAVIRAEHSLAHRAAALVVRLDEAHQAYARCVTVVAALEDDKTMLDAERRQLVLVRANPRHYGVSKYKAIKSYQEVSRELRRVKADLKHAVQAERKALKHQRAIEAEQKAIAREQKTNRRAQERLGLIPRAKRRDTLPALVELAQFTGLLDGSY